MRAPTFPNGSCRHHQPLGSFLTRRNAISGHNAIAAKASAQANSKPTERRSIFFVGFPSFLDRSARVM
jgi:hypothetical protein